ncbi:methyl-accepting chemotaxis protein [Desulfovibrio sp. JC022]|uniref:methyl-accepting chemotaxis protein n=1 Tax=Desulfovibrio sp. JC022 TaxID=2593642 RepID=UPI0013D0209C|nr:methyl-accepting chemotaxis protein [Desulfovibrio sp. JC022]
MRKLNISIAGKLVMGFGIMVLILCGVGVNSFTSLVSLEQGGQEVVKTFPYVNAASNMENVVNRLMWLSTKVRAMEHTTEVNDIWKQNESNFNVYRTYSKAFLDGGETAVGHLAPATNEKSTEALTKALDIYENTFAPAALEIKSQMLRYLELGMQAAKASGDEKSKLLDEKDTVGARLWELDFEVEMAGDELFKLLHIIQEQARDEITGAVAQSAETGAMARMTTLVGIGAGILISIFLGLFITRSITKPVRNIIGFAETVADGELNAEIKGTYSGELERLVDSIRVMVAELKNKLGQAQGIIDAVAASSPCLLTDAEGRISLINKSMLDVLGKSGNPGQYVGVSTGSLIGGSVDGNSPTQVALKKQKRVQCELDFMNGAGVRKIIDICANPIVDLDGNKLGVFTICFDLTEIREKESMITSQAEKIASIAGRAELIAAEMNSSADALIDQVNSAADGAAVQNERTTDTATAIEELNATVIEVASSASEAADNADSVKGKATEGAQVVGEVVNSITSISDQTAEMKENMDVLGDKAQEIGSIMSVIQDIADQTNLLALNAAIEAARAGEAGRGFAVVADEVRKLAEKTMDATQDVGKAISAIQAETDKNIRSTEMALSTVASTRELADGSGAALNEIVEAVNSTVIQARHIAEAGQQQSEATEQISLSVEEVSRISSETAEGMTQARQAVDSLAEQARQLHDLIAEMQ